MNSSYNSLSAYWDEMFAKTDWTYDELSEVFDKAVAPKT